MYVNKMPFQVCYVSEDDISNPVLEDTCRELDVQYSERCYNPYDYSMDKNYIERLPAFHIFDRSGHIATYYSNNDIDNIEIHLSEYNVRKLRKKTNSWKRMLGRLLKTDSSGYTSTRVTY